MKDGADWAAGLEPQADTLSFLTRDGDGPADANAAEALYLALGGADAGRTVFHSYAAALNIDGIEHALSGVKPGGEALTIGFEDLLNGGDRDYQDVVFTIQQIEMQPI